MFSQHVLTPTAFAVRFAELLPEYLPGVDTGAFEPTDRRRCWNKTLKAVLTVMGKEDHGLDVATQSGTMSLLRGSLKRGVTVYPSRLIPSRTAYDTDLTDSEREFEKVQEAARRRVIRRIMAT
jgi:hypothetical protein